MYIMTYSLCLSLEFVCGISITATNFLRLKKYILVIIIICIVGFTDVVVCLYKFMVKTNNPVSINYALRKEILEYTFSGIRTCAVKAETVQKESGVPSEAMYVKDIHENPTESSAIYCVICVPPGVKQNNRVTHMHEYAPQVFRYIREDICELTNKSYAQTFNTRECVATIARESYSEGRSGSFFYFTYDSRFIVKTITHREAKFLVKILKKYVLFLKDNPGSLISKIVGLYSLHIYNQTIYVIAMENVFIADYQPDEKYDIKGSWVDRRTNHTILQGKVMKDNDILMKRDRGLVILSKEQTEMLLKQLEDDSKFLASLNIMDYSFLLGIYYIRVLCKEKLQLTRSCQAGGLVEKRVSCSLVKDTEEANFETDRAKIFAGLTQNSGCQKLKDYIRMIQIMMNGIWYENDCYVKDKSLLPELQRKEVKELERLKNLYEKLLEDKKAISSGGSKSTFVFDGDGKSEDMLQTAKLSKDNFCKNRGGVQARVTEGPGMYHMGIIDMLQEWDFWKKTERFLKTTFLRKDPRGLSAIAPALYQRRFMDRMHEIIKDEAHFFVCENVDVDSLKQNSHDVHIWPTMQNIQDKLVKALRWRTAPSAWISNKHRDTVERRRMRSSPPALSQLTKAGEVSL